MSSSSSPSIEKSETSPSSSPLSLLPGIGISRHLPPLSSSQIYQPFNHGHFPLPEILTCGEGAGAVESSERVRWPGRGKIKEERNSGNESVAASSPSTLSSRSNSLSFSVCSLLNERVRAASLSSGSSSVSSLLPERGRAASLHSVSPSVSYLLDERGRAASLSSGSPSVSSLLDERVRAASLSSSSPIVSSLLNERGRAASLSSGSPSVSSLLDERGRAASLSSGSSFIPSTLSSAPSTSSSTDSLSNVCWPLSALFSFPSTSMPLPSPFLSLAHLPLFQSQPHLFFNPLSGTPYQVISVSNCKLHTLQRAEERRRKTVEMPAGVSAFRSPLNILQKEICAVCYSGASGYHYGVQSCEGCKSFFRRSVKENRQYNCMKEKKCVVDRVNKNRCQACRFAKCVEKGMSREAVRQDKPKVEMGAGGGGVATGSSSVERKRRKRSLEELKSSCNLASRLLLTYSSPQAFPKDLRVVEREDMRRRLFHFISNTQLIPEEHVEAAVSASLQHSINIRVAFSADERTGLASNVSAVELLRSCLPSPSLSLPPTIIALCTAIEVVSASPQSLQSLLQLHYSLRIEVVTAKLPNELFDKLTLTIGNRGRS